VGEGDVLDDEVVLRGVGLDLGPEAEGVLDSLRRLVDPVALGAVERTLLLVVEKPILAHLGPDLLEQEAGPPDDGIGAQEGVAGLDEVVDEEAEQGEDEAHDHPDDHP
jgi:hypothetical protein